MGGFCSDTQTKTSCEMAVAARAERPYEERQSKRGVGGGGEEEG